MGLQYGGIWGLQTTISAWPAGKARLVKILRKSAWSTLNTGNSVIQSRRTATTVSGPEVAYALYESPGNGTARTIYRRATLMGTALKVGTKNVGIPGRPPDTN